MSSMGLSLTLSVVTVLAGIPVRRTNLNGIPFLPLKPFRKRLQTFPLAFASPQQKWGS